MAKLLLTMIAVAGLALPGISVGDDLRDAYARLEAQRHTLETQREGYEVRLQEQLAELRKEKASWDSCVDGIQYPERVCWEEPRLDAAGRERSLTGERAALEELRGDLESRRRALESRRRDIEQNFESRGRGRAYEAEFRSYMSDLSAYLDRTRDALLPEYDGYLGHVGDYTRFVGEQGRACQVRKPCEFAERITALSDERERVQETRRSFERKLNASLNPDAPIPAMLQAAQGLWSRFSERPHDGPTLLRLERTRAEMEQARAQLEVQRSAIERQRAVFDRERQDLEATRARLEAGMSDRRRGSDYQRRLLDAYVDPMRQLLDREKKLFENYGAYEKAVIVYVYWIRDTVQSDPAMREIAASTFAAYGDELRTVENAREKPQPVEANAIASVEAPEASSGVAPRSGVAPEPAVESEVTTDGGERGVAGTLLGLMREYVGTIRGSVRSLSGGA